MEKNNKFVVKKKYNENVIVDSEIYLSLLNSLSGFFRG